MEPTTPYSPPTLDSPTPPLEIPEDILKSIKYGWMAAVFSGSVTLILGTVAWAKNADMPAGIWLILNAGFIFLLGFFISRKSRTAGTILFIYFLMDKLAGLYFTRQFGSIFLSVVLLYFFYQAMVACYEYQGLKREQSQF